MIVALDIGGTFTDLVAFDLATGSVRHAKSSTTPYDLAVGIRETLLKSGIPLETVETFIHGSTTAINTAIERTGARTALLVTEGTRDVYRIGRGNRPEAYNLFFKRPEPYVPRHLTFEVTERLNAEGEVVKPLDREGVVAIAQRLKEARVETVAVCFIHAWANPAHEAAVGEILAEVAPEMYRSLSHDILREYREYERMSTTVLNSYVGPRVSKYLQDLEDLLRSLGFAGRLLIMQSNGGSMSPTTAKRIPVAMMESGPVGGIIAAAEVGRALGIADVIAFDMGGTTAKVSLVRDNKPDIAQGYFIGGPASGHPVMLPVVDIIEVGAGGGSIAWIDEVGALKVAQRRRISRPGMLRTRRDRADRHRCERRLGPAQPDEVPRGRDAARRRGCARSDPHEDRRAAAAERRRGGARHREDRDRRDVARRARRLGRARLRSTRLRAGRVRRRGAGARGGDCAGAPHSAFDRPPRPRALLRVRDAAGRSASRLRPHLLSSAPRIRFRRDREDVRRDDHGRMRAARARGDAAPCDDGRTLSGHPLRRSRVRDSDAGDDRRSAAP